MATKRRPQDEPEEWTRATERAREARQTVADQLAQLIRDGDQTGSHQLLARRLVRVAEARTADDPGALRAALMELSVASAQYAVAIDLGGSATRAA